MHWVRKITVPAWSLKFAEAQRAYCKVLLVVIWWDVWHIIRGDTKTSAGLPNIPTHSVINSVQYFHVNQVDKIHDVRRMNSECWARLPGLYVEWKTVWHIILGFLLVCSTRSSTHSVINSVQYFHVNQVDKIHGVRRMNSECWARLPGLNVEWKTVWHVILFANQVLVIVFVSW